MPRPALPVSASRRPGPPAALAAVVLGGALLLLPGPLSAQTVQGIVLEARLGFPVEGAHVLLLDAEGTGHAQTFTDAEGRFLLRAPSRGEYRVRVGYLGQADVESQPLALGPDPTQVLLHINLQPLELEEITVEVGSTWRRGLERVGFYRRQRTGFSGYFLTEEEIAERRPIQTTDLLRGLPGVMMRPNRLGFGWTVLFTRSAERCAPEVVLDGFPVETDAYTTVDDLVHPSNIAAVEVHTSLATMPILYTGVNQCGAILIWTK